MLKLNASEARELCKRAGEYEKQRLKENIDRQVNEALECVRSHAIYGNFEITIAKPAPEAVQILKDLGYDIEIHEPKSYAFSQTPVMTISWSKK